MLLLDNKAFSPKFWHISYRKLLKVMILGFLRKNLILHFGAYSYILLNFMNLPLKINKFRAYLYTLDYIQIILPS